MGRTTLSDASSSNCVSATAVQNSLTLSSLITTFVDPRAQKPPIVFEVDENDTWEGIQNGFDY